MTEYMKYSEHENRIRRAADEELHALIDKFSAVGITWPGPEITIFDKRHETYTSECVIYLYRNNDLFDVIEFFLYYKAEVFESEDEMRLWLRDELNKILAEVV